MNPTAGATLKDARHEWLCGCRPWSKPQPDLRRRLPLRNKLEGVDQVNHIQGQVIPNHERGEQLQAHTGKRHATRKPSIIDTLSDTELRMLSPVYPCANACCR